MRHYFSRPALVWRSNGNAGGTVRQLRPIPDHPGGMHPTTSPGLLTALGRSAQRLAAGLSGAIDTAVELPAVTATAHDDLAAAPRAHEHTARPQGGLPIIAGAA
jgi:hypothetical protein